MKEWKIRQDVYHKLNHEYRDQFQDDYEWVGWDPETLVPDVLRYFSTNPEDLTYPSKSIFVGIVYAELISSVFKEDFIEVLSDADLLYGNDPFFKPYTEIPEIYDAVLEKVKPIDLTKGQCPDVVEYWKDEFSEMGP